MAEIDDQLRRTLAQIEQSISEAERLGAPVPAWLDHVAAELRDMVVTAEAVRRDMAPRMRADPGRSLDAQAHLGRGVVKLLKS